LQNESRLKLSGDSSHIRPLDIEEVEEKRKMGWEIKTVLRFSALILLILLVGSFIILAATNSGIQEALINVLHWMQGLPVILSALMMVFLFSVALLLVLSVTALNLASGFLYGVWIGCGVSVAGCVCGNFYFFIFLSFCCVLTHQNESNRSIVGFSCGKNNCKR
jgi:hypothetical protein